MQVIAPLVSHKVKPIILSTQIRRGGRQMKKLYIAILLMILAGLVIPMAGVAQDDSENITIRTLSIDFYAADINGVKVMYRGFDNVQRYLYLPKSFEGTYYRFVMAPKGVGTGGLPALIFRMRGSEVLFVDIYTKYLRANASIADFNKEDLEQFRAAEERGKVVLEF
jgi:hypothetical protein